ncbi:hypothetical protein C8A05DRAFT_47239 [Staphylotrichum tortipilum]|uniref:Suppressor of anucleate metulae protein B n=1 Tax=Staphylotrichum tortipilum TaxID=2831512 RepID=A0AAN6MCJ8_9PEZI|nr:hypothetical protein C8A05DRAFT_47239 [Staphylotrichum longicolle]
MAPGTTPDPPGLAGDLGINWDDVYGEGIATETPHMHTEPGLCKTNIDRVASSFPLVIRAAKTDGADFSGLWADANIEPARDIYRVCPLMAVPDRTAESFCHNCLESAQEFGSKNNAPSKTCTGCKAARFCSKECQKSAWAQFHKDECKVLQKSPMMTPQHLMAHRLLFWQNRGKLSNLVGKSLRLLETHFVDFQQDPDRANDLLDVAVAVREATGSKVNLAVAWKLVPAMRINCVRLRHPSLKETAGFAYDTVTAMINHSCDPNAILFFEGRELRLRSLKKINAGTEITISYIDPTLTVSSRQTLLQREYFFDCHCKRCKSEITQERWLATKGENGWPALLQAQEDIRRLIRGAVRASKYPGIYPAFEDLPTVETKLRTIISNALPQDKPWPEHMEPLPSARLSMALLYLQQDKPIRALRSALTGKLLSTRIDPGGAEWVNEMFDVVVTSLVAAGSVPPDAAALEDKKFPKLEDIRTMAYGYLLATHRGAEKAFGEYSNYTLEIKAMLDDMVKKKPDDGATPGTSKFASHFAAAQKRTLAWAGVPKQHGITLSVCGRS